MKCWKLFFIFYFFTLISCKKTSYVEDISLGYEYQPSSTIGNWWEYKQDSIIYSDNTSPIEIDTFTSYLRYVFESTYLDASGDENIRVELYKKQHPQDPWHLVEIGSVKYNKTSYQTYFNDLRFINLVFPIRKGLEWQGNQYLDVINEPTLEYLDRNRYDWTYRCNLDIQGLQLPYGYDGSITYYSDVVEVIQIDEENLFEKKYANEIYAKNVGLIYKEMLILNTQAPPSSESFLERAESGFILKMQLVKHGS